MGASLRAGLVSGYPFPITGAKIHPPLLRSDTLSRPRLNTWLDRAAEGRVGLIVAEAGFGKTTLLADWASTSKRRTAWYRLEPDDKDWLVFLRHLVAAGRELSPEFGADSMELILALGAGGPTQADIIAAISREYAEFGAALPDGLTLIIDDFHAVDGAAEIEAILKPLIERTGEGFSLLIASRSAPTLPLGRLRAHGGLNRIDGEDLCFDVDETDRLFREAYHHPLESDVIAQLIKRTEGWAALLTLVRTSLEDKAAPEARALVAQLSATRGDLYDFLAEEVLATLSPALQRFLTRVSVLVSVDPETGSLVDGLPPAEIVPLIAEAESLGLLTRPDRESPHRFHPLVRDFLQARLREEIGDAEVRRMHAMVAEALEDTDWVGAAWHYRECGRVEDAAKVVDGAVRTVIARGTFDVAAQFLDGSAGSSERPGALILRSRQDFVRGNVEHAIALAERAAREATGTPFHGTALLSLASLLSVNGYADRGEQLARQALDVDLTASERAIAMTILAVRSLSTDGNLEEGASLLAQLAAQQERDGQHRYAAITCLYLSATLGWRGDSAGSLAAANDAATQFMATASQGLELVSILGGKALALTLLGDIEAAETTWTQADRLASASLQFEVALERARAYAALGDGDQAEVLLSTIDTSAFPEGYARSHLAARLQLAIRRRDAAAADGLLAEVASFPPDEICSTLQTSIARARAAILAGRNPRADLDAARSLAQAQRSHPGRLIVELLDAVTAGAEIDSHVVGVPAHLGYCLSWVAEELTSAIDRMSPAALERIAHEAGVRPARWRAPLMTGLGSQGATAIRCAQLLASFGTRSDAALLRTIAAKDKRLRPIAAAMTHRLAPPVYVHDLGPIVLSIGGEPVRSLRRKVLALLCFLISRAEMAATRDEVVDALWGEVASDTAGNSLHQTIYFLRRVFEPDYREGVSADYVRYDGEVASLNTGLVDSASRACWRILAKRGEPLETAHALLEIYRARFALEFAYEDWAADYRDTLHAAVLSAVEAAVDRAIQTHQPETAVPLAQKLLEIDPEADGVEAKLLRAYRQAGHRAAAAEQYAHYSAYMRDELGVEPPSIDEV